MPARIVIDPRNKTDSDSKGKNTALAECNFHSDSKGKNTALAECDFPRIASREQRKYPISRKLTVGAVSRTMYKLHRRANSHSDSVSKIKVNHVTG